jgi:uncharacterized protein (DUF2147 family)
MRATFFLAAFLLAVAATPAIAGEADAVVGLWATAPDTEDGQAHVKIYEKDGLYHGKIVWLEIPVYPDDDDGGMAGKEKVDRENPDESLRDRPIMGLPIMFDFTYKGKNKYAKGTIYAPDDGKTYKCKLTLEDANNLKVRGYIGVSMLGRTEKWTRVEDEE